MRVSQPILRCLIGAGLSLAGGLLLVVGINGWMVWRAQPHLAGTPEAVPQTSVAIVLGTSPGTQRWANPFFASRMDAAAKLYHAGRVRHLLLSGDNRRTDYDEPSAMREALLRRGVPTEAITLDCAGFRTLDTMARARAVFGVKEAVIVTDDFHQARSLFLADAFGIQATGFASQPVPFRWSKQTRAREIASRVWAMLDVYILQTKPHFSGPPVGIRGV